MARRRSNRTREYQRSARLKELLREIIAEELCRQIGRPISQAAGELGGFKFYMNNLNATFGIESMKVYEELREKRKDN